MYKNVYFDGTNITLWEITPEGKTKKITEKPNLDYYIPDHSRKSPIKDFYGNPVIKKTSKNFGEFLGLRKAPFKVYEGDLPIEMKYLQERYLNEDLKVDLSKFTIMAFDIELEVEGAHTTTTKVEHPINLITAITRSPKGSRQVTFAIRDYKSDSKEYIKEYRSFSSELDMLVSFIMFFRKSKIDILTGYNIEEFDIPYLVNRFKRISKGTKYEGLESKLSPVNSIKEIEKTVKDKKSHKRRVSIIYEIGAITVMDYITLIRKFTFETLSSYSLNSVSMHFLNKGKLSYEGTIKDFWKTDWEGFVDYNIQDTLLIFELDDFLKFIELAIYRSYLSLNPLENYHSPILIWTGTILKYLHKRSMVLANKNNAIKDWWKEEKLYESNGELQNVKWEEEQTTFPDFFIKGGHVEAKSGLYFKVLSFDAKGLYPSNIIFYNVSPETKVIKPRSTKDLIKTPINGVYYRSEKGILPTIIEESVNERDRHKALSEDFFNKGDLSSFSYHNNFQMVLKINNNSLYGALCNKNFHLFDVDNARVITRGGRVIIRYLSKYLNKYVKEYLHLEYQKYFPDCKEPKKIDKDVVVLMDTDSCYITIQDIYEIYSQEESFLDFAYKVEKILFQPLIDKLVKRFAKDHNSTGFIYFKREGIIEKDTILGKKRYIPLIIQKEKKIYKEPKIDPVGLETERSSFPSFCQEKVLETIKELYKIVNSPEDLLKPEAKYILDASIRKIKKEFFEAPVEDISIVSSVQKYEESCEDGEYYVKNGLVFESALPIYYRASCVYNYIVKKHQLPLIEITGGDKIKYIYVYPNNETRNNVIAYIGSYPEAFIDIFQVNYELQFEKTYFAVLQRLYEVLGWGKIEIHENLLRQFKRKL